jgi:hypothetical protein
MVRSTGYTESYHRYYLRDVRGFLIQKTGTSLFFTLGFSGIALLVFIIVVFKAGWVVALLSAALPLVGMISNLLLGPSCEVHVITGVQIQHMECFFRLRRARKVLGLLRPAIEAAQADLVRGAAASTPAMPIPVTVPPVPELPSLTLDTEASTGQRLSQ